MKKPFDLEADYQPESFKFSSKKAVNTIISRYPKGFIESAIMPLLDLAQRQVAEEGACSNPPYGGWIPRAAMDEIALIVNVSPIKIYEVATFYSMYNLAPVGKFLLQVCTTTPCWLCGSSDIVSSCKERLGIGMGETTKDGLFTLVEVECLGACVNAPMIQINDNYYEDLSQDLIVKIIDELASGRPPSVGSQTGRQGSMALGGPTSLDKQAKSAGIT